MNNITLFKQRILFKPDALKLKPGTIIHKEGDYIWMPRKQRQSNNNRCRICRFCYGLYINVKRLISEIAIIDINVDKEL